MFINQGFRPLTSRRYYTRALLSCINHKRGVIIFLLSVFISSTIILFVIARFNQVFTENRTICSKLVEIIYNSNRSLCSEKADRRGIHQKVISLSVFGPKENQRFEDERSTAFLTPLINEAKNIFPEWSLRLYSDEITINRLDLRSFASLSSNIDICNVNELPIIGDASQYLSGKLWRFIPALDPTVDYISSRDLDSPLTEREKLVIDQFVNSSFSFLTIRDHPLHGIPILGGLWTAALNRDRLLFLDSFSILLDRKKSQQYALALDQLLLTEIIWPKVKFKTLAFDSYTCEQFKEGNQRSFPSPRPSLDCHLGCVRPCCQNLTTQFITKPCPIVCRPQDHIDWIYC